jgi:hypothetical protein
MKIAIVRVAAGGNFILACVTGTAALSGLERTFGLLANVTMRAEITGSVINVASTFYCVYVKESP